MFSGYRCGMNAIDEYDATLDEPARSIAAELRASIAQNLPSAEGKVWHGHPVWFLDGNPIVGYSIKKAGVELLFWSGQSFDSDALRAIGKFQAAALSVPTVQDLNSKKFTKLLKLAVKIQWDYANLPKNRKLVKLTDF